MADNIKLTAKDKEQIERIKQGLKCSYEEALEVLISDKAIDKGERMDFDISKEQVINFCRTNNINYVFMNKKIIAKYLIYKGYANNVRDTYDNLIGRSAPYYYGIHKLSPKEVIELISNTGGISIWAHPELMKLNNYLVVDKLKSYGLNGIEITKKKKDNERKYFELISLRENFITTYGSDFHDESDEIGVYIEEEKGKKLIKQLGGRIC